MADRVVIRNRHTVVLRVRAKPKVVLTETVVATIGGPVVPPEVIDGGNF